MSDDKLDAVFDESKAVTLEEPAPAVVVPEAPVTVADVAPATGETATPPVAEKKSEPIPIQALLDERDRRQKSEREMEGLRARLAEYEAKNRPAPPDIFADPEARLQFENQQFQAALVDARLDTSRFLAEKDFGKDVVEAAFAYFDQNPQLSHQFLKDPSPFHAAVEFYKRQKVAEQVGPDLDAYRTKLRAEIEAEVRAQVANAAPSQASPRLPGSIASAPAAGKSNESPQPGGFESAFG